MGVLTPCILATALSATTATPELRAWLEDVRAQARLPGLAVVIVPAEGEASTVFLGEDAAGKPVGKDTLFAVGSLSKSFTAFSVLVLSERGAFTLDQSASTFLPELDARITIRQLLNQTSGLPGSAGFWLRGGTLEERVGALRGIALHATPGADYQYSNANYDALGLLVERAAKKSYARFLREDVLSPLGIREVWARAELAAVPDGHQDWFGVVALPRAADEWNEANTPSGGLFATASGLGQWLRLQLRGRHDSETPILSEEGFRTLHTAATTEGNYAMGWTVRSLEGQPMVLHSGQTGEFTSTMALFPSRGFAVAALANVNAFQSPATRLTVRDIVPGAALQLIDKAPTTSSVFGYRNQPASKWLFLAVLVVSLLRFARGWRQHGQRPRWHAAMDAAVALGLVLGIPLLANVPLSGMARFNPDLVFLLAVGAGASALRAGRTLFMRSAVSAAARG